MSAAYWCGTCSVIKRYTTGNNAASKMTMPRLYTKGTCSDRVSSAYSSKPRGHLKSEKMEVALLYLKIIVRISSLKFFI